MKRAINAVASLKPAVAAMICLAALPLPHPTAMAGESAVASGRLSHFIRLSGQTETKSPNAKPAADEETAPPAAVDKPAAAVEPVASEAPRDQPADSPAPAPDTCTPARRDIRVVPTGWLTLREFIHVRSAQQDEPSEIPSGEQATEPRQPKEAEGLYPPTPSDPTESARKAEPAQEMEGFRPLDELNIGIGMDQAGDLPKNEAAQKLIDESETVVYVPGPAGSRIPYGALMAPGEFPHRPLYFEEANLERYGTHRGLIQPAVSAVKFYGTIPLLPYKMTLEKPHHKYLYSHAQEAGRCYQGWQRELPPLRIRPTLVEAGVVVGLVFLLP